MTSQLALDLPAAATAGGGETLECAPGQELVADMAAISSMIPWFGKRANTARADLRRPIAYLYGRPAVMSTNDKRLCCAATRGLFRQASHESCEERLHQLAFVRGLASSGGGGDFWVRVNGEKEGQTSRELVRRVLGTHALPWSLEIAFGLGNDVASARAETVRSNIERVLRMTCSGWMSMGGSGFIVRHLAPLVLALRWDAGLEAAVILARHGVLPNAVELVAAEQPLHRRASMPSNTAAEPTMVVDPRRTWDALVDAALDRGQPWAERLALLGKLQPSSSVVRALRWVSEQPR